jgi:diacylglycerol O-acyltransferase / wax synthase
MTSWRQPVAQHPPLVPAERVSSADLMQFAVGDGGASRQVGAILILGPAASASVADAKRLLAERIGAIPRFRQQLVRRQHGHGRLYWADTPGFDALAHISEVPCPPPGDDRALLDLAAARLAVPLPTGRPLWSATFVTGLTRGRTGLVIVVDHVITDGIAALTVLNRLADPPAADTPATGAPAPGSPAAAGRANGDGTASARSPRIRDGLAELGGLRRPHPARTSLNRPTGPRRRLDVVATDLAAVREFAHEHGGTVNDVVLAAVAGALRDMLAARGEQLPEVTISVPVSARPVAPASELGNQVGMMPVVVPTGGAVGDRVTRIAAITRDRKSGVRGSSAALFVPAFLLLARAGLLRPFVNHQRFVNTFVTSVRGPAAPRSLGGRPVDVIVPIPAIAGNVTVSFAVLSYAGTLRITVLSDPSRLPDITRLNLALGRELSELGGLRS